MEKLTKLIEGKANGAESTEKGDLTGWYGRGIFHATACVEKLADYEDLEEQGLLVKLPCKVGSIVYEPRPDRGFISVYEVTMITITSTIRFKWMLLEGIYSNLDGFSIDAIGKTVFLTRDQAEQALREQEET